MKSFIGYYQAAIGRPWASLSLIQCRLTITFGNRTIDLGLALCLMKGIWLLISITFNLFDPFDCRKVVFAFTQTSFEFQVYAGVCFQVVICYCDYSFTTDVEDKDQMWQIATNTCALKNKEIICNSKER